MRYAIHFNQTTGINLTNSKAFLDSHEESSRKPPREEQTSRLERRNPQSWNVMLQLPESKAKVRPRVRRRSMLVSFIKNNKYTTEITHYSNPGTVHTGDMYAYTRNAPFKVIGKTYQRTRTSIQAFSIEIRCAPQYRTIPAQHGTQQNIPTPEGSALIDISEAILNDNQPNRTVYTEAYHALRDGS